MAESTRWGVFKINYFKTVVAYNHYNFYTPNQCTFFLRQNIFYFSIDDYFSATCICWQTSYDQHKSIKKIFFYEIASNVNLHTQSLDVKIMKKQIFN